MKKLLSVFTLLIVLSSCGYERVNGNKDSARIIYKISSNKEEGVCNSKYYFRDIDHMNGWFGLEYSYVLDTCGKWGVGDTIKLN